MNEDTSKYYSDNPLIEQVKHLSQSVKDLTSLLESQQKLLRQRGMSLPGTALQNLDRLKREIEQFTSQAIATEIELRHLRELFSTTALITSSMSPDEVLNQVMDTAIRLTGAERGYIMLRNRSTGELEFTVARNIDREKLNEGNAGVSTTIVNTVAETGEPALTSNASSDPRFQSKDSIIGMSLRSIMAVPLITRDEIIGVVYCDNRFMVGVFKQHEMDLLTAFANQAATAIENARLFEAARGRLAEVRETQELLTNILSSITSGVIATDQGGIINTCNTAAEEIIQILDDAVGKDLLAVLPDTINGDFADRLTRVRQDGAQERVKAEPVLQPLGPRVWNMILSPLRDSSGSTQGVALVLDDLTEIQRREAQVNEVRRYLPLALVENIHTVDADDVVNGQERIISAISTDVRGFTTFSEQLEPEELMQIINKYLSLASDAINLYEGVVDKFLGDAVTGLFNTQLNPQEDHAVRAVRAALSLMYDLDALHEVLTAEQRLFFGAGIHTGPAVLGNVGSPDRKEFAAIGDATEVAKVLEGNARAGEVIISADTYAYVQDFFTCEAFTPERVKHRTDITVAYRVTGLALP